MCVVDSPPELYIHQTQDVPQYSQSTAIIMWLQFHIILCLISIPESLESFLLNKGILFGIFILLIRCDYESLCGYLNHALAYINFCIHCSTVILEFDLQLIVTKLFSTASYTEKCAL